MKGDVKGEFSPEKFCERIIFILKQKGISVSDFCTECNITRSTFYNWACHCSYPRIETVLKCSKTLGVTTEYLVLGEEINSTEHEQKVFYSGYCKAMKEISDMVEKKSQV